MRGGRIKREEDLAQQYAEARRKFTQREFTYANYLLLKGLVEVGRKHGLKIHLHAILAQIVRSMMMNQMELLFLGSIATNASWQLADNGMDEYIEKVNFVERFPDLTERKVYLTLLLTAYVVKINFNSENDLIKFAVRNICGECFERMYQAWTVLKQKYCHFNPMQMNSLYRHINSSVHSGQVIDYNRAVDQFCSKTHKIEFQSREVELQPEGQQEIEFPDAPNQLFRRQSLRMVNQSEMKEDNQSLLLDRRASLYPYQMERKDTDNLLFSRTQSFRYEEKIDHNPVVIIDNNRDPSDSIQRFHPNQMQ